MVVQTVPKAACCTTHILNFATFTCNDLYQILGIAIDKKRRDVKLSTITTLLDSLTFFDIVTVIAASHTTFKISCEILPIGLRFAGKK